MAFEFTDRDVYAERDEDEVHHYLFGDTAELFLKPADHVHYWELYATPRGRKTTFFVAVPRIRKIHPSGLRVAAQVKGTLNRDNDIDQGWTAEMAKPRKDLSVYGARFGPADNWRIFVVRYNVSTLRDQLELSMTPPLSRSSFHMAEEYAELIQDP